MIKGFVFLILLLSSLAICHGQQQCDLDSTRCHNVIRYQSGKISIQQQWQAEYWLPENRGALFADVDNDCIPEIIIARTYQDDIVIIDSRTGEKKYEIETLEHVSSTSSFLVADFDKDGNKEIVIATADFNNPPHLRDRLVCYDIEGNIIWVSDERIDRFDENDLYGTPATCDFNHDGVPEIYIFNKIYNGLTGVLLAEGGRNGMGFCDIERNQRNIVDTGPSVSIAANFDSDTSDIELAAGYTVYEVKINNPNGFIGNSMMPLNLEIDGDFKDGPTSLGDINLDGVLDIIVNYEHYTKESFIYVYTIANGQPELLARASHTDGSSLYFQPLVCDLTDSGTPSILIADNGIRCYYYDGSDLLKERWSYDVDAFDIRAFDLNNDGLTEIIANTYKRLYLLNQINDLPEVVESFICGKSRMTPLVGELDNTGETKICLFCGDTSWRSWDDPMLTMLEAADSTRGWSPSRGVWNQFPYYALHINDDVTVPTFQMDNAKFDQGKFNNFLSQHSSLNADGTFYRRASSLFGRISCINYDLQNEEYIIYFNIYNHSDASLTALSGMPVGFYSGDPQMGGQLVGVYNTGQDIPPGDSLINLTFTLQSPIASPIFMVVNSDRNTFVNIDETEFQQLECDYFDNFSQIIDLPEIVDITDTVCAGEDYVFLDTVILLEGEYFRKIQSRRGCDSIVGRLSLTTSDSAHVLEIVLACDSITWRDQVYFVSGTYKDRISVPDGCDSIYTLEATINPSVQDTQEVFACDYYVSNTDTIYDSGIYTFLGQTSEGCDSSHTIDLQINHSSSSEISHRACKSYLWKGNEYTSSGMVTFDTLNADGCDSSITLNLTIEDSIFVNETINICDGDTLVIFGEEVTSSKTLQRAFISMGGCDSLHTVNVLVDDVYRGQRGVSFCEGDSVFVIDRWFSTEGSHDVVKLNPSDCDSIITVVVTELEIVQSFDTISLCEGDTIQVFDTLISSGSNVARAFMSSNGCDSISNVNILERPAPVTTDTIRLCQGDTLDIFGQVITSSADLSETYTAQSGCDSTSSIHVSLANRYSVDSSVLVCPDDSVLLNGHWLFSDTTISISLQTVHGCDSIVNHDIHFLNTPEPPTFEIDCELGLISASISPGSEWDILWDNGDTTSTTFYQSGGRKEVSLSSQNGCFVSFTEVIEDVPDLSVLGLPGDTTLSPGSLLRLQLGLDNSQWKVLWLPDDLIDCNTCLNVNIKATTTTEITIILSHVSGCDLEHRFFIQFDESIYVPNIFTPNGDNLNDVFTAYFTDNISILRCEIYDRWGELVFSSSNDNGFGWDGTFNGENAPSAVYTYKLEYESTNNERKVVAGDLTLLR